MRRSERGRSPDGGPWSGTGQEPASDQKRGIDDQRGSDQPLDGDSRRKKGKERRAERKAGARTDLPDLSAGGDDPDYDWIRSLGDGRSPGRGRGPGAATEPGRPGGGTAAPAEPAGPGAAYERDVAGPAPRADLPGFSPDTGTQPGLVSFAADPGTGPGLPRSDWAADAERGLARLAPDPATYPGPQHFAAERVPAQPEFSGFAPEPSAWPAVPQLAPEPGTQLPPPMADFGPAPAEFPLPDGGPWRHDAPHPGGQADFVDAFGLAAGSEPAELPGPAGAFGPPDTFWSPSPRESRTAQETGAFGPADTVAPGEPRRARRSHRSRDSQSPGRARATAAPGLTPLSGTERPVTAAFARSDTTVIDGIPAVGRDRAGQAGRDAEQEPGADSRRGVKRTKGQAETPGQGRQRRRGGTAAMPEPVLAGADSAAADLSARPAARAEQSRAGKSRRAGRKRSYRIVALAAVLVVAAGAAAAYAKFGLRTPKTVAHVVSAPRVLGAYTSNSGLAAQMHAGELRHGIVARAGGEARNVVAAVYETAARTKPDIILFIGGNLSGSSASAFISSFTGLPKAFTTAAGSLGGQAACVPGSASRPAECAWADGDTFGVLTSPTLGATGLAGQLRLMRPLIERAAR